MRSVVVVGAGVGGLAVAGALARTGWQVTLVERSDRLRPGRSALFLSADGMRALRALGLSGGLDAIASGLPDTGLRRFDGQWLIQPDDPRPAGATGPQHSGAVAYAGAASHGAVEYGGAVAHGAAGGAVVHEADLHDALIAGLGGTVDVRTGVDARPLRGADRPAVGGAGATFQADLVIAADGAASSLRSLVAPESVPVSAGSAAWRAVIPWYRAPLPGPDVPAAGETIGGAYRFRYASLGERGSAGGSSRGGV